jgi:23S rRNA-/tRNA-specific pseudouridylate synthase
MVHIAQENFNNKELAPVHRLGRGTTGSIIFTKVSANCNVLLKFYIN